MTSVCGGKWMASNCWCGVTPRRHYVTPEAQGALHSLSSHALRPGAPRTQKLRLPSPALTSRSQIFSSSKVRHFLNFSFKDCTDVQTSVNYWFPQNIYRLVVYSVVYIQSTCWSTSSQHAWSTSNQHDWSTSSQHAWSTSSQHAWSTSSQHAGLPSACWSTSSQHVGLPPVNMLVYLQSTCDQFHTYSTSRGRNVRNVSYVCKILFRQYYVRVKQFSFRSH